MLNVAYSLMEEAGIKQRSKYTIVKLKLPDGFEDLHGAVRVLKKRTGPFQRLEEGTPKRRM